MKAQVMNKLAFEAVIGQGGPKNVHPTSIHNSCDVIKQFFSVLMSYMSLEGICVKQSFAQKGNLQLQTSLICGVCIQQTLSRCWPAPMLHIAQECLCAE